MILLMALIWGLGLILGSGGSLRELRNVALRFEPLLLGLFVIQGGARGVPASPSFRAGVLAVWATSGVLLFVLLLLQHQRRPLCVVAVGLGLNLLVVLANQGMPVLAAADGLPTTSTNAGFYHQASAADVFVVLADVLPLPGGWMLSLGDLLVVTGIMAFLSGHQFEYGGNSCASGCIES